MSKTFASFSFGCRVNQAEKEEIDKQLLSSGFAYDEKKPSIYIINTCAVTAKAEREVRQFINQIRRKYPKTKTAVTGCAATKWMNEKTKVPNLDWLIDNSKKEYIAQLILQKMAKTPGKRPKGGARRCVPKDSFQVEEAKSASVITPSRSSLQDKPFGHLEGVRETETLSKKAFKTPRGWSRLNRGTPPMVEESINDKYANSKRLLLKIQDGCQRFCTYCIVPYLRRKPKSVPIDQLVKIIIERTEALKTPQKIKEVILTAINTEAYGLDTGEKFTDLVKAIIKETKIPRISFGSINPWSLDDKFFAFYKGVLSQKRLVNFFHVPLQSGSDKILSLMKRGYTSEEFVEKIKRLKSINSFAFIGTDVIVGFLEEEDRNFEDTYNFLADSPISKFHIFRFSKREKTAAFYMAKKLKEPGEETKKKRAKILAELGKKKYQQFLERHLGSTFPALFLDKRIGDYQEALLDNQIPVLVKTNKNLAGEIRNVKIEELREDRLWGKFWKKQVD